MTSAPPKQTILCTRPEPRKGWTAVYYAEGKKGGDALAMASLCALGGGEEVASTGPVPAERKVEDGVPRHSPSGSPLLQPAPSAAQTSIGSRPRFCLFTTNTLCPDTVTSSVCSPKTTGREGSKVSGTVASRGVTAKLAGMGQRRGGCKNPSYPYHSVLILEDLKLRAVVEPGTPGGTGSQWDGARYSSLSREASKSNPPPPQAGAHQTGA